MVRILTFSIALFLMSITLVAQEATAVHEINKGAEPNEYIVKTSVSGLKGVDIARATYKIDDTHAYQKVLGNELFSSRNKDYIKFYVMGVPESGEIVIELGLTLANNVAHSFPVEFQYSRNDEKKIVQFPELVFEGEELLASEETISKNEVLEAAEIKSDMEKSSLASPTITNGSVGSNEKPTQEKVIVLESTVEIIKNPVVKNEATIKEELADTKVKYTIQLLSLSKFSQARFDEYCDEHSLLPEEVTTRVVNGMTKVIYGKANSLEEAKKLIDRLKLLNNIDGAFAVPL